MKTILLLLALALPLSADEYRQWEDLATGKKITARILGKERDNSKVQVITEAGKAVWIETKRLVRADIEYVQQWGDEIPLLSATIKGEGKAREITFTVNAEQQVKIVGTISGGIIIRESVSAGDLKDFTYPCPRGYDFFVMGEDGKILAYYAASKKPVPGDSLEYH